MFLLRMRMDDPICKSEGHMYCTLGALRDGSRDEADHLTDFLGRVANFCQMFDPHFFLGMFELTSIAHPKKDGFEAEGVLFACHDGT